MSVAPDQALALVPFYAGARIAEVVALDVDDVGLSARKGLVRLHGKGDRVREVPRHRKLRSALRRRSTSDRAGPAPARRRRCS